MAHLVATLIYLSQIYSYYIRGDIIRKVFFVFCESTRVYKVGRLSVSSRNNTVCNAGPTLNMYWLNVSSLLGSHCDSPAMFINKTSVYNAHALATRMKSL